MRTLLITIICILSGFTVAGVLCAVTIGRRRDTLPADPFSRPFGEMPGFTTEQLRQLTRLSEQRAARDPLRRSFAVIGTHPSAGDALHRRDADGGGRVSIPSWLAAVRGYFRGQRRHA